MSAASSRFAVRFFRWATRTPVRRKPCRAPTSAASWIQGSVMLAMGPTYGPHGDPASLYDCGLEPESHLERERRNLRDVVFHAEPRLRQLHSGAHGCLHTDDVFVVECYRGRLL